MARGDDIEERLIEFAVRVVKLCGSLPKTPAGNHVAGQLLRSGTAPAALYAEARGAESTKDFVHKLKICLKELNESRIWLIIITRSELLPESRLQKLIQACEELGKIINASIKTARSGSSSAGNVPAQATTTGEKKPPNAGTTPHLAHHRHPPINN